MKILIHDFAGHPFQAELSRALSARGHQVIHAWFAGDAGPKGTLRKLDQDPDSLAFKPFGAGIDYSKTNFIKRRNGDVAYGREVAKYISLEQPDVVISGNTPSEAQEPIVAACRKANIPFIYWCQDFYSIAASRLLEAKLPVIGHLVGAYYRFLERRQMRRSAKIIHITEAFCAQTDAWGISRDKVAVIPNWGALDEIDVMPRDNEWSQRHGLGQGTRFIYTGTLAMKHNPELLAALSKALGPEDELILVAAGVGAEYLADLKQKGELPRMRVLPLQPFEDLPLVLGSADVLLAVIEREAGTFSVPSKILSYLCAGRPIVLAAPKENLAAHILFKTGAGLISKPEDTEGFVTNAIALAKSPEMSKKAAAAARDYAEENFKLNQIASNFETLFFSVSSNKKQ